MEAQQKNTDTTTMDETRIIELLDYASELACEAFDQATDAHTDAVYERLVWNETHGLGSHGAVTVH